MPATTLTTAPLIDAAQLMSLMQAHATDTPLLILDARFNLADVQAGELAYAQGHLPGALYAHLDRDLSGPKTGSNGRHPLPTPEALSHTLGRWGWQSGTRVIVYDDHGGMFAARAWWLLRWLGIDQVQVLDGGLKAWLGAGGTLDTEPAAPIPTTVARQAAPGWVVDADWVLAHLNRPDEAMSLLDARSAERFMGIGETLDPVGGHIPGALNRWFGLNLQEGGTFKPATQLRQEFQALLPTGGAAALVHQCGSGVTACHNLLAMAHAGFEPTRLYAGSWSEWCTNPNRPMATP